VRIYVEMLPVTRRFVLLRLPASIRPLIAARLYATNGQIGLGATSPQPAPRRRSVTPFNDNGKVPWGELSGKEKVARTTQQSFNFGFIILGAILTVSIPTPLLIF
jgi:import inner membrane translocase subunit TIM21